MKRKRRIAANNTEVDINFLYEMGSLRHVARTWNQFGGLPMANDAEHTFRVGMIAWILAEQEGADVGEVLRMALVHDMTETRTGDVQHMSRLYTERHEEEAVADQTEGICAADGMRAAWREYEKREKLAAQIVKDADNLDVDMEVMESIARGEAFGRAIFKKRALVRDKLFTDAARRMFDAIRVSDPCEWYIEGKNRFNSGDWKT